jgi:hypothetical protein
VPLTLLVCWLVSIAKPEPEEDWRLPTAEIRHGSMIADSRT